MFNLNPNPTFSAVTPITVPGVDQPAMLTIVWRHKGRADLKAWIDTLGKVSDEQALLQVIADWEGVVDDNRLPVPFGRGALADLLDAYPASGGELCTSYLRALTESRLGNSERRPALSA